jgi:hypothetical protein
MKFLITFSLLLVSGILSAQEQEASGLQARFVAQNLPQGLAEVIATAADEEGEKTSEPFLIPKNNLSERFEMPGRAFTLKSQAGGKLLSKISLPEKGRDFIILLVPGRESLFRAIVLDSKNPGFRPGDFYLLNSSQETVVAKVGTTQSMVPSNDGEVVSPEGAVDERYYNVLLGVREGNGARTISSSRWPVSQRMRTYVFFFDHPQSKEIDFRAVDEFVPEE